jgi:hypothetical protein
LVERVAFNHNVAGSIPAGGIFFTRCPGLKSLTHYQKRMSLIFTTCFFDINTDFTKDKPPEVCFTHFTTLAQTGIQIHLFLSPCFREIYERICGHRATVRVEYIDKDTLHTFREIEDLDVKLPSQRTEHHDTRAFLTTMNAKAELVYRTMLLHPLVSHFAWIDFSIFHVIRQKETAEYLRMLSQVRLKASLLMPGCWTRSDVSFDRVHWRFCGGFFLGERQAIQKLYTLYRSSFRELVQTSGLSWEVNVWAHFEHTGLAVEWYPAGHDDSIVRLPPSSFYVAASLTSIPSRAESLRRAIDSLLPQVDEIRLSIPVTYRRFTDTWECPDYLKTEAYSRVRVIRTEDLGPATKYLGGVGLNCWVFVCDDDQEYNPTLLERMKSSLGRMAVYQNHYESIVQKTSGGCIHGYVGLLIPAPSLRSLPTFPLPASAYFVDDQWMSIYCLTEGITILSSGVNEYSEIYKVLDSWHELIGVDALSHLNTRDICVRELESFFRVKWSTPNYVFEETSLKQITSGV